MGHIVCITGDDTTHPSHPILIANGQSSLFVTAKPSLKHQDFDLSAFEPKHFICMFYQVLGVPHSSSSTPTWGSVLPSIVETRDQNSRGCPLLFSNRNLGSFCA